VQARPVWLPAATLESGPGHAPPLPPPASPGTPDSSVSLELGSRGASAGGGGRNFWLRACRRQKRRRAWES
jgi:hypothetical protein